MTQYEQSKEFAANPKFRWAAAVRATSSSFGVLHASSVAVAPDVVLGAGHFTPSPTSLSVINEVVFGANYNDASAVRVQVSTWQQYPGYVQGDATTVDLGVYRTASFIPDFKTLTTFASVAEGETAALVDYGNIGDPSTGEMPSLGDRMGGRAPRRVTNSNPYPESRYDFFRFDGAAAADPLNVQGLNYSSGAPWFDADGRLTHLLIAKTNGTIGGVSIALELNTSEVQSWLQPIISDSWQRYYATFTPGDANTDGAVNFADLSALAANYNTAGIDTLTSWTRGDFTADGLVDFSDLLLLAANYGTGAPTSIPDASPSFQADWAMALASVPEPSSLGLLAGLSLIGLRRRRPS